MVYQTAKESQREPTDLEILTAVQRNFGGYFGDFDPTKAFIETINLRVRKDELATSRGLVVEAIRSKREGRYLLLLTKNNVALRIIQDQGLLDKKRSLVIFGSSFPHDQQYTQICNTIKRIKLAMEVGHTVVLVNLNNGVLESLYDALNQYTVKLGNKEYVDLGLGTHRVKCAVHEDFRLIVVAEDSEARNFPIPLINRLEKHFLGMETMMDNATHGHTVNALRDWVAAICDVRGRRHEMGRNFQKFRPEDVFIGYHGSVATVD